jgi:predicted nucleotidyltransferase
MSSITALIRPTLARVEEERAVKIWFAVESGSRAWGFESTDSDYDVRFIYLSSLKDYLTVFPRRDVIENADIVSPDPLLDFSGWDFRKFLGLVHKSNPVCFEWMQSLIVYKEAEIWKRVRQLVVPYFSPKAAMHHYLSMARHNYREHMRDGSSPSVKLKKYLYITRPLLCCRWIERDPTAGPPPMPFIDALNAASLSPELRTAIDALVERKKAAEELDEGAAVPVINQFIDAELARLPAVADAMPDARGSLRELDAFLHEVRDHM